MLKSKRKEYGLSQARLSKESGVSKATIEYWERSQDNLKMAKYCNLKKVADVLHVTVDELVEGTR